MQRQVPEMSQELLDHFAGKKALKYPLSLLWLYTPGSLSRFCEINPSEKLTANSIPRVAKIDSSFPAQMRDAVETGILTPGCTVITTARSAIPCADAVRGFAAEKHIDNLTYEYLFPDLDEHGVKRLADIFSTRQPNNVIVIDEFTTGDTILRAGKMVLEGLRRADVSSPRVGLVPGWWYSMLVPSEYIDCGMLYSHPEFDGGNYVDYENVTLPQIAPIMRRAGQISAHILDMVFSSASEASSYAFEQLLEATRQT